jgi:hypothetical protein
MRAPSLYETALALMPAIDGPPQVEVLRIGRGTITVLARPSMMEQARRALAQSPLGRPPNTLEHNLLLHAAFCAEREKGLSLKNTYGAAARRLGSPINAEKVRRATAALRSELSEWFGPMAQAREQELVAETRYLLEHLQARATTLPVRHLQRHRSTTG